MLMPVLSRVDERSLTMFWIFFIFILFDRFALFILKS